MDFPRNYESGSKLYVLRIITENFNSLLLVIYSALSVKAVEYVDSAKGMTSSIQQSYQVDVGGDPLCLNVWIGLVSLFDGISTFVGYSMTHLLFEKNNYGPKGICSKVNIIAGMEFEFASNDSTVQRLNHYNTRTPPLYWRVDSK